MMLLLNLFFPNFFPKYLEVVFVHLVGLIMHAHRGDGEVLFVQIFYFFCVNPKRSSNVCVKYILLILFLNSK